MKFFNNVTISVFSHEQENINELEKGFRNFLDINYDDEKISIDSKKAQGFNEKKITILSLRLEKQKHIKTMLDSLLEKLESSQIQTVIYQLDSRVDNACNFFIRLDKKSVLNNQFEITDSGDCYHLRFNVAAFPKSKENALVIVRKYFDSKQK